MPAGLLYVALGVGLFSTSPVLARWALPYSPFEVTFGRMAIGAALILTLARVTGVGVGLPVADLPRFAFYGLTTAAHFLLYIWSLEFTTIAHSLAFVYTAPLFVTWFSGIFLGEHLPRRALLGIPVVVAGVALLTGFEPRFDARMALGDLMALGSAACFGIYSVAGRGERARQPLLRYAGTVYLAAAVWLLPFALLTSEGWQGVSPTLAVAALGIFPLAIGHTLYNASLRRAHPTYVNLIATQEVTGGVMLGAVLLGEWPAVLEATGAILLICGVALVLILGERGRPVASASTA